MHAFEIDQATITLRQLREQRTKTSKKISNLMTALADGVVEASATFKATMQEAEADAKRIADLIGVQERILGSQMKEVTLEEAAESPDRSATNCCHRLPP